MPMAQLCERYWRLLALAAAMAVALATALTGAGGSLERALQEIAWERRAHPSSGQLHVVEIDGRSISSIDRWPWPRSHHAQAIDALHGAGVASIAFDVDFSSRSIPAEDAALAEALRRADGKVILPTFRQRAGGGQEGWTDSLPIAPLREHSLAAAVSILPSSDGYVRRAPFGIITEHMPRPSLAAMIAGVEGRAGVDFPIDFAIDPSSIPRHSFVDIARGNFDPSELAGKHVLIGATAVEMGDRYVVPVHGVLPGVVIQALAAETLMDGSPKEAGWPLALPLAGVLAWLIARTKSRRGLVLATIGAPLVLFGVALAAQVLARWYLELAPALVLVLLTSVAVTGMRLLAAARHRLFHDAETGLPNRKAMANDLSAMGASGVVAARIGSLDKIGASLGAEATAELILRVRDRLSHVEGGATIYRIDGRVLAWRCDAEVELDRRLGAVQAAMLHPIEVRGRRVDVTLALGYARGDASDAARVIGNAAVAAARGKTEGASWHLHNAGDEEEVERELSLLGELDEAIDSNDLSVVYQPKLDIARGSIASVEALVRWNHRVHGFMRPDLFIPLAERSGRVGGLTLFVLRRAIADLQLWRAAGREITAAVNVSAKLLDDAEFNAQLRDLIRTSEVPLGSLTFEVTESAAMRDPEAAAAALRSFRDMGIAISIDDYGTGQSTLSYLKQLPLNELKIDRAFVQHAHCNHDDAVLVRSTVELAHALGLKVVAEGVEEPECLAFLRSVGCDMAQGYLISRPIPSEQLLQLLREPNDLAA